MKNGVAQFISQSLQNNAERISLVMRQKVFYVLEKKGFGSFGCDNSGYIKK